GNVETVHTTTIPIDSWPPTTTATIPPPNGNGWHNEPVTVTLTAVDSASGVEITLYQMNGGNWLTYTQPIALAAPGTHTVAFYSEDVAGNVETALTTTVQIDLLPPTTTLHLPPLNANGWYTAALTMSLTADDATSGIDNTNYQLNGGSWQTYTAPISLNVEGVTAVAYRSADLAGNVETVHTVTIPIDTHPPTTTVSVSWPGGRVLESDMVTITLTAEDTTSGVAATLYQIDNGGWQAYTAPLFLTVQGTMTFSYHSLDTAGNVEASHSIILTEQDTIPPVTAVHISPSATNGWHNTSVTITLIATDTMSGISSTYYWLNNGNWQTYTTFITLNTEGVTNLDYYSVDRANNVEITQTNTISIDMSSPTSIVSELALAADSAITVTWVASDTISDIDTVTLWYRFEGGNRTDSGLSVHDDAIGAFNFMPPYGPGLYCFATQATDKAGNVETSSGRSGEACIVYTGAVYNIFLPMILLD
ncbi:MAG: hypothetical protein GY796_32455, partial [Chloroflexi bacterium]|nr:hypothetical protein [Chloroflexota bacterium]